MRLFDLKIDLPFLKKGNRFAFDDDTGLIYGIDTDAWRKKEDNILNEYALRAGLSGYLLLLLTDGRKYLKEIK